MRVLVVSKSLYGYVSNQVQYNMESAQYLWRAIIIIMIINKYIFYIYIFNSWKILFCYLRFHEVYNNIPQIVKKMEWNWKSKMRQNTDKKPLGFRLCVVVSVWVYVGVRVCVCVWMCVFRKSQARNVKRWLLRKWVTNVYSFVALFSFIDSRCGTKYHHYKLVRMNENLICKRVW